MILFLEDFETGYRTVPEKWKKALDSQLSPKTLPRKNGSNGTIRNRMWFSAISTFTCKRLRCKPKSQCHTTQNVFASSTRANIFIFVPADDKHLKSVQTPDWKYAIMPQTALPWRHELLNHWESGEDDMLLSAAYTVSIAVKKRSWHRHVSLL